MRLLYAIQGTGNGHLSRAMELAPYLMKRANVDLLLSGITAELKFPFPFKYRYHGASFFFGKSGGVNYLKSFRHFKPLRLLRDIKSCPVENYDAIINDFEPVSAWAGKKKKVPVIALSHQASFFSDKVPLPKWKNKFFVYGMKHFVAPSDDYVGIHYKKYDDQVVEPIIRKEIQQGVVSDKGHVTVYLPAFSDEKLIAYFSKVPEYNWQVYSKKTDKVTVTDNVTVYPVNKTAYTASLLSCHALVTGGGFQGTSEGLFLQKKMLAIPMFDQYEQKCNAAALIEMNVKVVRRLDTNFPSVLKDWLSGSSKPSYSFQPDTNKVVDKVLEVVGRHVKS